ncbi:sensor histidine kinase [Pseudomonas vlassakiae]|jgi:signal transduction histidine kinase|uniref:sensor histidine kinase n=1 Tax=Pseudomonas TaxID=286 RepID=UPI000C1A3B15|nr:MULTISPECIES: ATP-binding protein [unclassified Pseudomonas]AXQ50181.1 HAMP domain-containing protein [Stenotrophomonas rhizophila]MBS3187428.1 HAMP domain-containing protein [Pseudomonas sp. PCH44]PIK79959.1 two-component sensor histidine kinase [Pseudomonas sp. 382]
MPWLRRLWPRTLFGQLLLIMVSGTLVVQLMSSSIWFDVRFAQVLEAPIRLMAARSAPLIAQANCHTQDLQVPAHYQLRCAENQPVQQEDQPRGRRRVELLLQQALTYELGHAQAVRLLKVQLTDEQGQPIVWRSLFGLRTAQAHIQFAVPLPDGHWLSIDGQELQGWSGESAWVLISDYLLRVYALRIVAVLLVCLIAVRLCLRPLRRLADAARGLGSNLEQPALALDGPEEVRQAALAFNAMQQRLIAMVKDKAHFLAAVSHDLRTPLTRMRLRLERLPDDEQRERLRQNITQMDNMIGQVLDYLRAGEQQNLQQVDLDRLVARLCADLASSAEPLPVDGKAGSLRVDALLLQRCLQNLVVNALRYARQVSVTLETTITGVYIHIDDRGPGIAPGLLTTITDPFVRGEGSRNQASGGYGLGLSIAQRIASSHGGELLLHNREGGGLRVSVLLPR